MSERFLVALWSVFVSLAFLITGVVLISVGTNSYVGIGVLFLILYFNSQKE